MSAETGRKLADKGAVITGASSGLGKAIALKYASQGAKIAVCDLNLEQAENAAHEIEALGTPAMAVRMDVSNEQEVNAGIDKIAKEWKTIDILVSNAGIQIVHPLQDFPFDQWRKMIAVHLDGAFLTTKACIKYMYPQKGGSLIYMGSAHSHEASPMKAAYVAAKHGILGLSRVMAKEGAHYNVRSNVICPGFVDTPLVRKQIPEQAKNLGISEQDVIEKIMLATTVDGQFTTIDDVANVALFLAAFETNALTGQSIVVSHGWHMN